MSATLDSPEKSLRPRPVGWMPKQAVALLTGGADRPYAFGLATALISQGVPLDIIGGDELDCAEFADKPGTRFLNLRGNQQPDAAFIKKACRVLLYYARLMRYAATAKPKILHILWNNKFEFFDRTLLMLYYKLLGKAIALTTHNVNAGRRDSKDTRFNRLTLSVQYRLADHIFVHTENMKRELSAEFGISAARISAIPFGINNAVPNTALTPRDAKERLRILQHEKTVLFFGHIAPYKGLECLIGAVTQLLQRRDDIRLIIAGRPKNCEEYWRAIRDSIREQLPAGKVELKAGFIPDEETEVYFKAADVVVLPYRHIYQSGVLFLGYSFGLPAIATDVGSFREDIVEGRTGLVCKPDDAADLARVIEAYFGSEMYRRLDQTRTQIMDHARQRNSWELVAQITRRKYADLERR